MFFCSHKKYSDIKEDGRQYCLKCNKAVVPPCPHKWKTLREESWTRDHTRKFSKFFQKCTVCGDVRTKDVY